MLEEVATAGNEKLDEIQKALSHEKQARRRKFAW